MKTKAEIDAKIDEIQGIFNELSSASLIAYGREYKLTEWITPITYARKYGKAIATVQNWISRGVVPLDCQVVIPELNNLRLMKDQLYHTRSYENRAKALGAQ